MTQARPAVAVVLAAALSLPRGGAAEGAPTVERLDLRELLRLTAESYPERAVVEAGQDEALAAERLASSGRWWPRLTSTNIVGLVPGAKGSIFESEDTARDLNDLGPFWRARLDFVLPLATFGRSGAAQRAARALVGSRDARVVARRHAALEMAARAYLGHLLAQENLALVTDIRKHLDDLIQKLENPEEGGAEADPLDLYKARGYGFQLDRLEAAAKRALTLSESGMAEAVGRPGAHLAPAAEGLAPLEGAPPDLEEGIREAAADNPELREADLAAQAAAHRAGLARKERLPVLSLDGRFEYGRAPGRTRQDNPFVYDPFNTRTFTAAFGLRWDLSFKQTSATVMKEEAAAAEARARRDVLRGRIRGRVIDTHARLLEARTVYETARRAVSTAGNWLRVAEENYGLGTASTRDVIDAYTGYVQARGGYLQAVHDLDLAVIGWRLALAREPLEAAEHP